jgi:gas vesicle protein
MDQDLKAYLGQHFEATSQQFQQLRADNSEQVRQLLEDTSQQIQQQIQQLREENRQQFAQMNQRLDRVETDVRGVYVVLDRVETEVRGAYVMVEDLRDQSRLIADGVANLSERLDRHEEKVSRDLAEVKSFNRLSYKDLDSRVRKLGAAG